MPFTSLEDQQKVMLNGGIPLTVGDMCREEYKPLIRAWRKETRWTTWHNLLKEGFNLSDQQAAKVSAFAVLFCKEVMDYEREKCEQNGDVY